VPAADVDSDFFTVPGTGTPPAVRMVRWATGWRSHLPEDTCPW